MLVAIKEVTAAINRPGYKFFIKQELPVMAKYAILLNG